MPVWGLLNWYAFYQKKLKGMVYMFQNIHDLCNEYFEIKQ